MSSLQDRVALITGASRGIGAATGRALAAAGAKVALASRSGDNPGIEGAFAQACDVRDAASLEAMVGATVDHFGRLDILVVNAGVGAYGPFLDLPVDDIEEMIDVNVKGAIYAVRAALPHLAQERRRRPRDDRQRGRPPGPPVRGRLLRLEVRPGRPHRAPSTTSCASAASAARTSVPAGSRPTSRWATAGRRTCRSWPA